MHDPSVVTAAERRNKEAQSALNARAAANATAGDMKSWRKDMDSDQKKAALAGLGSDIDPEKDPAGAARAYHDAMLAQHKADLASDTSKPQVGESTNHPDSTPSGQPIKYDAQGNAYIKGPDGAPVPYNPQSSTGGNGSTLALDSPEAQELAMDHPSMTGEQDQAPDTAAEDQEDQGLLAQQQAEPDDEGQPQEQSGGILS